jgi:uncharacterized protein YcsI (UPF0317 family)
MKNNSNLFYTCSLIEFIGRTQRLKRSEVVRALNMENISRIYQFADVFHCEPMEKTADDFITMQEIPEGDFDNVAGCRYEVPDYWTIGAVYERLIEDISEDDEESVMDHLWEVYDSWISDEISNYNSDFYYQSREYIYTCYMEGHVCE